MIDIKTSCPHCGASDYSIKNNFLICNYCKQMVSYTEDAYKEEDTYVRERCVTYSELEFNEFLKEEERKRVRKRICSGKSLSEIYEYAVNSDDVTVQDSFNELFCSITMIIPVIGSLVFLIGIILKSV